MQSFDSLGSRVADVPSVFYLQRSYRLDRFCMLGLGSMQYVTVRGSRTVSNPAQLRRCNRARTVCCGTVLISDHYRKCMQYNSGLSKKVSSTHGPLQSGTVWLRSPCRSVLTPVVYLARQVPYTVTNTRIARALGKFLNGVYYYSTPKRQLCLVSTV